MPIELDVVVDGTRGLLPCRIDIGLASGSGRSAGVNSRLSKADCREARQFAERSLIEFAPATPADGAVEFIQRERN